jgi:hypothetical protein
MRGLTKSLLGLILVGAVVYAVIAALDPWALHIGGRFTPFLTWEGSGTLHTRGGDYPLYVYFYPSSTFSRLHRDGLNPTGGLQGAGWLCSSRGVTQRLNLGGTIYGGWRSTENSLMAFRLNDPKPIDFGQKQGYFDLAGKWNGPALAMNDGGSVGSQLRSGLKIEHASVTFNWSSYSAFKAVCDSANYPMRR